MSFQIVSDRLKALQESNALLKELIDRLANLKFQPGSVPLDDDENNVKVELTSEIHQLIKDQDEDLAILQEDVTDIEVGRSGGELEQQKVLLDSGVKKAREELKALVIAFRRAQMSAKRSLEEAQREERKLLLQSYLDPQPDKPTQPLVPRRRNLPSSELSKEEKTVNASTDVTLALRRTHDMMAAELSRSQFAHQTLQESTAALAQLSETYSTLDTLLSSSKNLLGTLLRSQKSDTWYLETAFYVLLVTIAWLIFRRFLYGPAWWLVWLPVKMFWKGSMGVLSTTGAVGHSSVDTSITSVVGHSTIVHSTGTRTPIPTIAGSHARSMNVGGGGRGAPMRPMDAPQGQGSVSEQVGRIIDESRNDYAGEEKPAQEESGGDANGEGEQAQAKRNPMKRMWEEDKEAAKEAQRRKDEL